MSAFKAEVRIGGVDAAMLSATLAPEGRQGVPRTSIRVGTEGGDTLLVEISADELTSLRAALNSYLRWTRVAMEAASIKGEEEG